MIEEFKINERIRKKIENSQVEEPIKEFLLKILEIEFKEGKSSQYSRVYKKEIDNTYILLKRN
ncbi:MAG: hypothetical protein ISS25_03500 [Nanoarchaeota archaeon]|nr:hypothetical protein [DPANN group archaeon]MBL7116867.1 hypothetical protein [Nanoarchaeota archaeon]